MTRFWFRVENGGCSVVQNTITNRYAYYYVGTPTGAHEGDKRLCMQLAHDGEMRGNEELCVFDIRNFIEVDLDRHQARTITLR